VKETAVNANEQVTGYIEALPSPQREICARLRAMLADGFSQLTEDFKWSRPVYTSGGTGICYLQSNKADVNFGFNEGAQLNDPKRRLHGSGKSMRHVKIKNLDDLDEGYFRTLVEQAIALHD
jgi:hypothetical protein